MRILNKTESLCHVCFKKVPAVTFIKKGRVFIKKNCPEHGEAICDHFWDDPEIYRKLSKLKTIPRPGALLAVILTNKCNLNCPTCLASANQINISDFDVKNLNKIKGYKIVYLTGGEPTVRSDLPKIIAYLKKKGKKVIMISNGIKFADLKYAQLMKKSGLDMVRLQFDSRNDDHNKYIRGRSLLRDREKALKNLEKVGIAFYLCSVTIKNKNFGAIKELINYSLRYPKMKILNINTMWRIGRFREEDFVSTSQIVKKISREIKVDKSNWIGSTILMCSIDKLLFMLRDRRRNFGKCNLRCMVLRHKGCFIAADKVFNLKKINEKIERFYSKKSYLGLILFLGHLVLREGLVNFFINRNFRIFFVQFLKNLKYLVKGKLSLLNPFYFINVEIFQTPRNVDFNVINECNFDGISPYSLKIRPACLNRILPPNIN